MLIKISGITYDLLPINHDSVLETSYYGLSTVDAKQVKIDTSKKCSNEILGITIIHELLHTIQDECGFNNTYDELEITIMAKDMYNVLKELDVLKNFKRKKLEKKVGL